MRRYIFTVLGVLLVVSVACKKREEAPPPVVIEPTMIPVPATPVAAIRIVAVDQGKALGPDKKVVAAIDTFAAKDTIFTVVSTDGSAPTATVHFKVLAPDGQVVKEDTKTIAPTGPATTEFSIQKPSGWPKGEYKTEVSVDNGPVTTKTFTVK